MKNRSFIIFVGLILASINLYAATTIPMTVDFSIEEGSTVIQTQEGKENSFTYVATSPKSKFLLIRGGLETFTSNNFVKGVFYNTKLRKQSCEITGNYLDYSGHTPNENPLENKSRAFQSCIQFKITSAEGAPLIYEPNQKNCLLEKIDMNNVLVNGGECFFKNNGEIKAQIVAN